MAIRSLARSSIRQVGRVNSALAGYESNYFHHLETVRLGGNAASVTFSNLSRYSDYQHLQIRYVVRTNRGTSVDGFRVQLNGDTGSNYASHALYGDGVNLVADAATSTTSWRVGQVIAGASVASSYSGGIFDLLDAFETSKNKTVRILQGGTGGENPLSLSSGVYLNTNAITSITFFPQFGSAIVANSRFSLYGLKARA